MRRAILVVIGVGLLGIPCAQTQTRVGTVADEAAVLKCRDAHNVAIDNHDAKAVANLYAVDGDRISASGSYFAGRK